MSIRELLARIRNKLFGVNAIADGMKAIETAVGDLRIEIKDTLKKVNLNVSDLSPQGEFVPPGHFYSCIPSKENIDRIRSIEWHPEALPGIEIDSDAQFELLKQFQAYYKDIPFTPQKQTQLRYFYENPAYSYTDAIFLHCWLRHLKPKRVIEIGSGYSSCVTLDTSEKFFDSAIDCTFIEPYADLLKSLIKPEDCDRIHIIETALQDVDLSIFNALEANDILFIDSTHVSKVGSDVNQLIFEILPRLNPGVLIHMHDIFYPFEYPLSWLEEGRAWNEQYILRAFLQFNNHFRIRLLSTYVIRQFQNWFGEHMSDCLKNPGGSIWIEKTE
ncbi:class I SAM-dependent methyltransferase [Synechococcus sp. PCC 7336]|uniref:class I SAM-dependent methyltransferase n=1 Tax=Synechococcus sp. PCC 7336 TaxID=195250 RepID=UPI000348C143|nr:class I SAM-dependent methyltransferase [Synechococcus sp. PCC 7336]